MDSMKILSQLYDLLSQCSPNDLEKASRAAGRDNELSDALGLMASYRRKSSNGVKKGRVVPKSTSGRDSRRVVAPRKLSGSKGRVAVGGNGLRRKMSDLLLNKEPFSNNRELIDYLRHVGVPLEFDGKDSRKRIVSRLFSWLNKQSAEKQKKISLEILSVLPPSETSGWFDAMKSPNS